MGAKKKPPEEAGQKSLRKKREKKT